MKVVLNKHCLCSRFGLCELLGAPEQGGGQCGHAGHGEQHDRGCYELLEPHGRCAVSSRYVA